MTVKKDLIEKLFQVTGITCTDPATVRSNDVLQKVLATAVEEMEQSECEVDDFEAEDPFADLRNTEHFIEED